jgi:uncharacterized protein YndB with AHSA1/START domain
MIKKIILGAVVLIACVLAFAATKPDTFSVQRTATIKAPPEKIYPLISDFRNWSAWSPYEKRDPAMKKTHTGAEAGRGAVYEWDGNNEVGRGRMEIVEATPPAKVTIKLDFLKPFEAQNVTEFTLQPSGDSTTVTWAMNGPNLYVGKVMSIFVDMDRMVGNDFESGLANLKAIAER